jgi:hypothetical protein
MESIENVDMRFKPVTLIARQAKGKILMHLLHECFSYISICSTIILMGVELELN